MLRFQPVALVSDGEHFVAAASCGRSPIAANAVGFSIATIAAPYAGTRHCSSASLDVPVETDSHTPSANTSAFAAAVTAA